ncbi:MAG TPA: UDP-N-acetylmuramate dehydrogenase [Blastocatellia bacterium]|nr:UDP-N-acetylmuramate dehydrogenase [Blastocatellia bacterium]
MNFERLMSENVPLAPFTTLGVGGPSRYFAEITDAPTLTAGVAWAKANSIPLFILGGGSNVVISDDGFAGLTLLLSIRGIQTRFEADKVIVTAGAGEEWDALVALCVENGWAGVECLSGIPGRVGATPIQNVGAYGQETADTLISVTAYDRLAGRNVELSFAECEFGYRASRFKFRDRERFIITSVTYQLLRDGEPTIRYAELQNYLQEHKQSSPDLKDTREAVLAIRRRKAMVIDAEDMDSRSVGSFFVNPTITVGEFERVKQHASPQQAPFFPATDGKVKLSAAWLIEQSGFHRGYVRGNVGLSSKHALAIINRGGGTAREVIELAEEIKMGVQKTFGIVLMPEPVLIGFADQL